MNPADPEQRPSLEPGMLESELRRWYWLRSELVVFARALGISTAGGKVELTARIADVLTARTPRPPTRRRRSSQLAGPLHSATLVPPDQRCAQELRNYLIGRIGPGFHFDRHMREVVAAGGVTLEEVVQHWYDTRDQGPGDIAPRFEYNQFTRAWRTEHPDGHREALLSAWWEHRTRPRSS
jgi:hypothetical protein